MAAGQARPWVPGKTASGGLLFILLGTLALAACSSPPGRSGPSPGQSHSAIYAGARVNPPVPRPEFTLTDTSGLAFDFQKETAGHLTLLFFGYTHCPDVCPLQLATVATALKELPEQSAQRVQVVFVTTDPQRDTPEVLRQWLDHFDQRFIGLTGTLQTIALVERQTGVPAAKIEETDAGDYGVDHAGFVIVYTPDNLAHLIYPEGVSADGWAHDLVRLVQSGGSGA